MAAKKFWIRRANLPLDKNKRKLVTVTLRWKEEDKSHMIGGVYGQIDKHITIGPDDIIEGEQFVQFVKEGILEPWTEAKANKDAEAMAAVSAPVVAVTTAPKVEVPKPEVVSKAVGVEEVKEVKKEALREGKAEKESEKRDRGKKVGKRVKRG